MMMMSRRVNSLSYSLYRSIKQSIKSLTGCQQPNSRIVKPMSVTKTRPFPDFIQKPPYLNGREIEVIDIEIKNQEQIQRMREACKLGRQILNHTASQLKVGMTTDEIDVIIYEQCIANNCYPSPLYYKGFPKSVCTSVNNVICHGIPDLRPLMDGDIINIDITVYYNGYHGDLSETYLIGQVDEKGKELVETTRRCRDEAISLCRPGQLFSSIGEHISLTAIEAGFNVVPDFAGHGIGSYFHGPPTIYHCAYYDDEKLTMKEGMTFTIEPILIEGSESMYIASDGWTALSKDESRSAQFEHTVLITADGVEILTS